MPTEHKKDKRCPVCNSLVYPELQEEDKPEEVTDNVDKDV